jgi:DNA invertase Pin-like site-specific DNA recombinase
MEVIMGNIAYYRVSTKKQGESGLGLESQKAIVCHFIDCNDLVAEFTEQASGKDIAGRPELQKAIALCISGGHTLVVAKLDRLSRKTEDALDTYARLNKRLIACDIPTLDKFTLTIHMAMADRERELISIRTKAALKVARARGVKLGNPGNLPADAGKRGAESKIRKAQEFYRPLYNYIRMMRADGMSYDHIAARLNDDGHTTRLDKPFYASTVYRIVQRNGGVTT